MGILPDGTYSALRDHQEIGNPSIVVVLMPACKFVDSWTLVYSQMPKRHKIKESHYDSFINMYMGRANLSVDSYPLHYYIYVYFLIPKVSTCYYTLRIKFVYKTTFLVAGAVKIYNIKVLFLNITAYVSSKVIFMCNELPRCGYKVLFCFIIYTLLILR